MTETQLITLKYFALGYSVEKIATKQKVSTSTIRSRIKLLEQRYPEYFENACGVRNAYKRLRYNVNHPSSLDGFDI